MRYYFLLGAPFLLVYVLAYTVFLAYTAFENCRAYAQNTAPQLHPIMALFVTHRPDRERYDRTQNHANYDPTLDMNWGTFWLILFVGGLLLFGMLLAWPFFVTWFVLYVMRLYNTQPEIQEMLTFHSEPKPKPAKKEKSLNLEGIE